MCSNANNCFLLFENTSGFEKVLPVTLCPQFDFLKIEVIMIKFSKRSLLLLTSGFRDIFFHVYQKFIFGLKT